MTDHGWADRRSRNLQATRGNVVAAAAAVVVTCAFSRAYSSLLLFGVTTFAEVMSSPPLLKKGAPRGREGEGHRG